MKLGDFFASCRRFCEACEGRGWEGCCSGSFGKVLFRGLLTSLRERHCGLSAQALDVIVKHSFQFCCEQNRILIGRTADQPRRKKDMLSTMRSLASS